MPYALIHAVTDDDCWQPIQVQGSNAESSFYTDGPSITAVAGFVAMLLDLDGLAAARKGKIRRGVDITSGGFSFFLHGYHRQIGKMAYNSATANYVGNFDSLINPPVPVETYSADLSFCLVIQYRGTLPDKDEMLTVLNARSRRFNGGVICNELMITDIDEQQLKKYFAQHNASQVTDQRDLGLTSWSDMLERVSFFEEPSSKKKTLRLHEGAYYIHQTGYQLLELPCERHGALLYGDQPCLHAYCEPVINLAGLQHTTHFQSFDDLHLWRWQEDLDQRTVMLTTLSA